MPSSRVQTNLDLQEAPEEIKAIFRTIASTRSDIIKARKERVALANLCDAENLGEWDQCIVQTEAALTDLERLVEPARLDIQHNKGKIRAKTRLKWAMKESKSLSTTSSHLSMAHNRMLFAMFTAQSQRDQERKGEDESMQRPHRPRSSTYQEDQRTSLRINRKHDRENRTLSKPSRSINGEDDEAEWSFDAEIKTFEEPLSNHRISKIGADEQFNYLPEHDESMHPKGSGDNKLRLSSTKPYEQGDFDHLNEDLMQRSPSISPPQTASADSFPLFGDQSTYSPTPPLLSQNDTSTTVVAPKLTKEVPQAIVYELSAAPSHNNRLPARIKQPGHSISVARTTPIRTQQVEQISEIPELDSMPILSSPNNNQTLPSATKPISPLRFRPPETAFPTSSPARIEQSFFNERSVTLPSQLQPSSTVSQLRPRPPYPTSPIQTANSHPADYTFSSPTSPKQFSSPSAMVPARKPVGSPNKVSNAGKPPETHILHIPGATTANRSNTVNGVKNFQHSFAGHRSPVNIRWQSDVDSVPNDDQISASKKMLPLPRHDVRKSQYTYQPYRRDDNAN